MLLFLFSIEGKSTLVAGGDFSVNQIDDSTFLLKFRLYKYCAGANYPAKIDSSSGASLARIYENSTNNLVKTFSSVSFDSIVSIPMGDSCYTPPGLCIEIVYYSTIVILQPNTNGYYATWKICCKNFEGNFLSPNEYLFYAQIPNPFLLGKNSSPQFKPIGNSAYLCIGYEKNLDFSCTDTDGDSLVYSLITPFNDFSATGSKPLAISTYVSGFDLNKVLGPGSKCKIDSATGFVSVRPAQLGVFSISVKCEEYRSGIKIGEVTRTFVYSGLNCNLGVPIEFENFPVSYDFKISKKNCFDVVAKNSWFIDIQLNFSSSAFSMGAKVSLPDSNASGKYDFEWKNEFYGAKEMTNNIEVIQTSPTQFLAPNGLIGARFCWELNDCEFYNKEKHYVDVQAVLDRCGVMDTADIRLTINFEGPESSIYTPNSFSPNGDGIEDVFRMNKNENNECLKISKTKIYSTTGQLVFESEDPNFFWNGKDFLNKDVSSGIYMIVYEGIYGESQTTDSFKLLLFR
jgi:hypothetical protein